MAFKHHPGPTPITPILMPQAAWLSEKAAMEKKAGQRPRMPCSWHSSPVVGMKVGCFPLQPYAL